MLTCNFAEIQSAISFQKQSINLQSKTKCISVSDCSKQKEYSLLTTITKPAKYFNI